MNYLHDILKKKVKIQEDDETLFWQFKYFTYKHLSPNSLNKPNSNINCIDTKLVFITYCIRKLRNFVCVEYIKLLKSCNNFFF
jgi:hypothetical protein